MADGVLLNANSTSGATILTDDTGATGHAQVVKLAVSANGDATLLPATAANGMTVDVTRVAGDVSVVQATAASLNATIGNAAGATSVPAQGAAAHDAAVAGNPVLTGGIASAAAPTDVNADGDAVRAWHLRNGAAATVVTAGGALIGGDASNGLDVDVTRVGGTVTVDGSGVVQPVSATALDIRALSAVSDGVSAVVSDGGGSVTVDNGGTFAVQAAQSGTWNVGTVTTVTTVSAVTAITNALPAGDNNVGNVDIVSLPAGTVAAATAKTADFDTGGGTDTVAAFGIAVPASGGAAVVPGDATNGLKVQVAAALPAGSNAIGKLAANSGVDIGDVDILSIAAGDNNIGNVDIVSLPASTNTLEVVGDVAHDAAAAGNPVLVAGVAQNTDDTAPPNRVSAESDATRLATDWDGALFVRPHGPQVWSYHFDGSTAQTDSTVHASPGAGLSLYVSDIVCSTGAATALNVFFEEGSSKVLGPYYLEAVAGRGLALHFQTPKKITAATALTFTSSAAIAHCLDVTGYVAPG